jgi:hypothetical protein
MEIKKSVINTFNRVHFPYEQYLAKTEKETVKNHITGESVETSCLVARCICWVYATSYKFERGDYSISVADFDRIRYFILAQDPKAYMTCID